MEGTAVTNDSALNAQELFAAAMRGEARGGAAAMVGSQVAGASGLNPQDSVQISAGAQALAAAASDD